MLEKALKLIQPVSKRDQVVASFKEAILSGTIQPGDSIVESKVAQQLGAGIPRELWQGHGRSGCRVRGGRLMRGVAA